MILILGDQNPNLVKQRQNEKWDVCTHRELSLCSWGKNYSQGNSVWARTLERPIKRWPFITRLATNPWFQQIYGSKFTSKHHKNTKWPHSWLKSAMVRSISSWRQVLHWWIQGGAAGVRPHLRVEILLFWHTNFLKCSCLGSQCPPMRWAPPWEILDLPLPRAICRNTYQ